MANILIVDDSAFSRNSLKILVESDGHEVAGLAENGEQGLNLFKRLKPELVLLDYLMEGKNGKEVLKEIIQHDSSAKVIMVSGLGDSTIEEEALKAGAKNFVRKHNVRMHILKVIDQVLEDETQPIHD